MTNTDAILERVARVAAATFGCAESAIRYETTAMDVNGWDSLSHTLFILNIEHEFAVRLELSRVIRFAKVADLVAELARLEP